MADNSVAIAEIQAVLRSGVKTVTVDGVTTQFDLAALRRELSFLMKTDTVNKSRRPTCASIDLSRFP